MSRPGRWQRVRERARDAERERDAARAETVAVLDEIASRLLDAAGDACPPARGFESETTRAARIEFHAGRAGGLIEARRIVRAFADARRGEG